MGTGSLFRRNANQVPVPSFYHGRQPFKNNWASSLFETRGNTGETRGQVHCLLIMQTMNLSLRFPPFYIIQPPQC